MPILFRCPSCKQKLSISRKRAGTLISCPNCGDETMVPSLEAIQAAGRKTASTGTGVAPAPDSGETLDEDERPLRGSDDLGDELGDEDSEESVFEPELDATGEPGAAPVFREDAGGRWAPRPESRESQDDDDEPEFAFRKAQTEFEEMDLTPMVDVTFLLLIFFMITASFSLHKTIPTPVPDPSESSASQPIQQQDDILDKSIMIAIDNDNRIVLDDEPLPDPNLLPDRLQQVMSRDRKSEVLVTVSSRALQGTVVFVLDTANELNVSKIRLAAKAELDE
jgi:biopolymer transport protein ExbD